MSNTSLPDRELGYVLKTHPYRERDVIAVLFTENRGKLSAIARNGVQSRRFGGALDLFTCSEFELDPKTIRIAEMRDEALVQVLSGRVKHPTQGLSESFERLSGASALNELVLRVIPERKSVPELFKLYANALLALPEQKPEEALRVVNAFVLKLTQWLGVQPQLTRCLACTKALNEIEGESVFAEVSKGAWLCGACAPGHSGEGLTKNTLLDAYHSMLQPIRKIEFVATAREHERLLAFLEQHLQYHVPGLDRAPISSFRFLKSPEWSAGKTPHLPGGS